MFFEEVVMPSRRIKQYYYSHFVNPSEEIKMGSDIISRFKYEIYSFFQLTRIEDQIAYSFNTIEEIKPIIKRQYPNEYSKYNTMFACAYFFKQCLRIEIIQRDILFKDGRRVDTLYPFISESYYQRMVSELNKIRFDFQLTDWWTLDAEFKNTLYKEIKQAINSQARALHIDIRDPVEKLKDNTIGCLGVIIAIIAVAYTFMN